MRPILASLLAILGGCRSGDAPWGHLARPSTDPAAGGDPTGQMGVLSAEAVGGVRPGLPAGTRSDPDCDDPDLDEVCAEDDLCPSDDDRIDGDGDGIPDCAPPTFPEVADIIHINVRTGFPPGDSDDIDVELCLSETRCFDLVLPDWDAFEPDGIDVISYEGIAMPRSEMDRVEFRATGPDDWQPSCVQVVLDGELVYCNYDMGITFGDAAVVEWRDPQGVSLSCSSCRERLGHGPTIGAVTATTARIWVRTDVARPVRLRLTEDPGEVYRAPVVAMDWPEAANDFTSVLDLRDLKPATTYYLVAEADGVPTFPSSFTTAPGPGPARLRLALGSAALTPGQGIFAYIAEHDPDAMLFLGDTNRAGTTGLAALRQHHRSGIDEVSRGPLQKRTPTLATWGRQDFLGEGRNGTDPARDVALRAFREYWANPGYGTESTPGVFTTWSWGDIEVFLLDDRYERTQTQVLGPGQVEWLLDRLTRSTAPFKLVAGSSMFSSEGDPNSWAAFPEAREAFLQDLVDRRVEGVVLLSGGEGRSEVRRIPGGRGGYTLPLVVASGLSSYNPPCVESAEVEGCAGDAASFALLDVDTTAADPELVASVYDHLGMLLGSMTVRASELQMPPFEPVRTRFDVDGDGYADLPIGAPSEDIGLAENAGLVQMFYGSSAGLESLGEQLVNQNSAYVSDVAETADQFGRALATGDFDGDGYAELAIGVPGEGFGDTTAAGMVTVFPGSPAGLLLDAGRDWTMADVDTFGLPETDDVFGAALAAGDFDADGFDDLVVGAPGDAGDVGTVVIVFGSPGGLAREGALVWDQFEAGELIGEPGDRFGQAVSVADFDADGHDDLAVSSPGEESGGVTTGIVMVLFGDDAGFDTYRSRVYGQGRDGLPGVGDQDERFGATLSTGDFDGDGFVDLAIGAPDDPIDGVDHAGSATVVPGSALGLDPGRSSSWSLGHPEIAEEPVLLDTLGSSLAAGDLDGDGHAELVCGIPGFDGGTGSILVLRGSSTGLTASGYRLLGQADTRWPDPMLGERFGSEAAIRDLDADGRGDLIVGTPLDDVNGLADVGTVGILLGAPDGVGSQRQQRWHQDLDTVDGGNEPGDLFGASLPR